MFASLTERLQTVFATVRRETRLTPESVETALREIRLALLEADVNFKVVKAFINRVRDRAVDRAVLDSLTPAQQVVAIVRDELRTLLGDGPAGLSPSRQRPQVVLLLGLQGAGKTTTTVKLARWLTGQGRHPLVVSTDVRRPAAIEQSTRHWVCWRTKRESACTTRRVTPRSSPGPRARSRWRGPWGSTSCSSTRRVGCTSMTT